MRVSSLPTIVLFLTLINNCAQYSVLVRLNPEDKLQIQKPFLETDRDRFIQIVNCCVHKIHFM